MERIEYDPEIDPSIRQAREAAERDRELSARIRIEIERYVEQNDLVPRESAKEAAEASVPEAAGSESRRERQQTAPRERKTERETERDRRRHERETKRREKAEGRTMRARERRRAIGSVFTGSILASKQMRSLWPYLLVMAVMLVAYIGHTFTLQKLHLERQVLEKRVRELGVEAVERTAERERQTRRSEIVKRLEQKNIPLREFSHPVKTIEK